MLEIREMADSRLLSISDSQIRTTAHPSFLRAKLFRMSLAIFDSIFRTQYVALEPDLSFALRTRQSRPCQKSPSQKTTTRGLAKTRSGFPGNRFTFFRYRYPRCHRAVRKRISHFVSFERFRESVSDALADEDLYPSNLTDLSDVTFPPMLNSLWIQFSTKLIPRNPMLILKFDVRFNQFHIL
jgi:hypothetical protein